MRGNDLYVGGQFSSAGGVMVRRVALWNGVEWSALGPPGSAPGVAPVQVFALQATDAGLYVGGLFSPEAGQPNQGFALWNGSHWADLDAGVGAGSIAQVRALARVGREMVVGGYFGSVGDGQVSSHLARWTEAPDAIFADGYEGSTAR